MHKPKKNRRERKSLLSTTRWATYAAAGAATALGAQEVAEAGIVYSGLVNQRVDADDPNAESFFRIDFDGNNTDDLAMVHYQYGGPGVGVAWASGVGNGSVRGFIASGPYGTFNYASNLVKGVSVREGDFLSYGTMAFTSWNVNSRFLSPGEGYLGFSFSGDAGTHYGWLRVNMDGSPHNGYTVLDWAWEDVAGVDIAVGAVPEPGSLGLMAMGAIGLLLWRRARRGDKPAV